jgi:hypothetical protein
VNKIVVIIKSNQIKLLIIFNLQWRKKRKILM